MMVSLAEKRENIIPETLKEILIPVQEEVQAFESVIFELIDSQIPFVRTVAEYVLRNGGKRLRPILTIVCSKMAGFDSLKAAKMGACIEFIHTASLLHDDVIDNAKIRRGKPSTNAKWGNHISVLVGDFFYSRASQLILEQENFKILKVISDCTTATTEGEILEILKSSDTKTTKEDYLKIIENKTAKLFATACQVGGVLANVSEVFEIALRNYGYHLGMAFQLSDDVLDYTSSEDVFGKSKGIDLREGKLTFPLILSLKQTTEEETKLIKNAILAESLNSQDFDQVKKIIEKYHGFQHTFQLAKDYIEQAKESLSPFRASLEKDVLIALADHVIHRER